ncbi:hypothetical protein BD309DRAFT_975297, partial [Dichomitus squalens]
MDARRVPQSHGRRLARQTRLETSFGTRRTYDKATLLSRYSQLCCRCCGSLERM